jgi:hypothetical protein
MADFYPAFLTEWQTIINTVWPEIILPGGGSASNFFTGIQALKKNIESRMEEADPALPYCFVGLGATTPMAWTSDRDDYNGSITLFYIDSEANSATQTTINAKLQSMRKYVRSYNSTTFCQTLDSIVDSSDRNPVNSLMPVKSQIRVIGGTITFPGLYVAQLS